jgi:hypothetical protein
MPVSNTGSKTANEYHLQLLNGTDFRPRSLYSTKQLYPSSKCYKRIYSIKTRVSQEGRNKMQEVGDAAQEATKIPRTG